MEYLIFHKEFCLHTIKLKLDDSIYSNVMFLLENLKVEGLEIEEQSNKKDKQLSKEIEKSFNSQTIDKSHDEIFDELIKKYARN
jgi:hypothetical protein